MATVVVPFREGSAKSRLPEAYRSTLAHAMLDDVLAAAEQVGPTVVAREPAGQGAAVASALDALPDGPVLVVNADLPCVTPRDLLALLGAVPGGGLAFAEAADGTTNALALSHPALFEPVYGPGSASRFAALGASRRVAIPNLIDDVDDLDDLERLARRLGPRTAAAFRALKVGAA